MGWSAKHKWVSRSLARDEWIAHVSDEQIVANLKACLLAMTTRAHDFLTANDAADFLRASRALAQHVPDVASPWGVRCAGPVAEDDERPRVHQRAH